MPPFERFAKHNSQLLSRVTTLVVLIVASVFALNVLASLLQPLVFAIFLFFMGTPIIHFLVGKKVPLLLAQFLTVFIFVGLGSLIIWAIAANMEVVSQKIPILQIKFREMVSESVAPFLRDVPYLGGPLGSFVKKLDLTRLPDSSVHPFVGQFIGLLVSSVLVIFYLVFIFHEASLLPYRLAGSFGPEKAARIEKMGHRMNAGITRYLYVKFLASLIKALMTLGVLYLFGVDLVFLWSGIIFVANFIPYIGSIVSFIFPVAMAFLQFEGFSRVLALAMILVVIDMFIGNYWEPKYSGYQLNVNPILVLFWLSFWGWLWGMAGLFLAVPLLIVVKSILDNLPSTEKVGALMSYNIEESESKPMESQPLRVLR